MNIGFQTNSVLAISEDEARKIIEDFRWPNGIICPKCQGNIGSGIASMKSRSETKKKIRQGVYKCLFCRKTFTVTVGTIFERSHIPLNKWLIGIYLIRITEKNISIHRLQEILDITHKSAWRMKKLILHALINSNYLL